jgi:cytoskeletal protein CcmA (bactofilin family)
LILCERIDAEEDYFIHRCNRQTMKKIFILLNFIISNLSFLAGQPNYTEEVVINQPVHENLYIAGGTVIINAPVYADLIVAGGIVEINDSVTKDILLIGGDVTFNGYVEGDIRCAGAKLRVLKNIDGDLIAISGNISVDEDVIVQGLCWIKGGTVSFSGIAKRNLKVTGGDLYFNGVAEMNADFRCNYLYMDGIVEGDAVMSANEILIDSSASFKNNIRFWSKSGSTDFKAATKKSMPIFDETLALPKAQWYFLGGETFLGLWGYVIAALLAITVFQFFLSSLMKSAAENIFASPLKAMGWGLLFFIGIPLVAVVAFITIIGIPFALFLTGGYITIILFVNFIIAVIATHWINNRFNKNWQRWQMVSVALCAFILFKLLESIPFFGWLILIIAGCMSIGGILKNIRAGKKVDHVLR